LKSNYFISIHKKIIEKYVALLRIQHTLYSISTKIPSHTKVTITLLDIRNANKIIYMCSVQFTHVLLQKNTSKG